MITVADVAELHAALTDCGIRYWITGGWGIDALLGQQTRPHDDLDISVAATALDDTLALLVDMGFATRTDWLPTRIALVDADGREVDVHPLTFRQDGSAWLQGLDNSRFEYPSDSFTTGTIDGRTVPCITATLQFEFHRGYPPKDRDLADIAALHKAGLISGGLT